MRAICLLLSLWILSSEAFGSYEEPAPARGALAPDESPDEGGRGESARPAWISLVSLNKLPLHCEAVESELWATREQARADVLAKASVRAGSFVAEGSRRSDKAWQVPVWLVHDHLLREPLYIEEVDWKYGPMYRAHALIELSPDSRQVLVGKWREVVASHRLGQLGGVIGFVFVCLVTLVTYLRLDDATRGYYSRWLGLAATGAVAGSAALLYTWVS